MKRNFVVPLTAREVLNLLIALVLSSRGLQEMRTGLRTRRRYADGTRLAFAARSECKRVELLPYVVLEFNLIPGLPDDCP